MKVLDTKVAAVGNSWLVTGTMVPEEKLTLAYLRALEPSDQQPPIIKARDAVIGFNVDPPEIRVGPVLGRHDRPIPKWIDAYAGAAGAVYPSWRAMTNAAQAVTALLYAFRSLTVFDELPAEMVHEAFLAIEEYQLTLGKWIRSSRRKALTLSGASRS